jgi:hypothetical protein
MLAIPTTTTTVYRMQLTRRQGIPRDVTTSMATIAMIAP